MLVFGRPSAYDFVGFGDGYNRNDITISAAPLFHIGALGVHTLPFAYVGGSVVITEAFDPSGWLDLVAKYRVTKAFLVPAMWAAVAQAIPAAERDLSSLT